LQEKAGKGGRIIKVNNDDWWLILLQMRNAAATK
jgi:hypothetical protein